MSNVWILVVALLVQWVLSVVVKTAVSVPLIKNFEPKHRHLGRENVRRFAIWTAPLSILPTAIAGALYAFDAFMAPGALGFLAVGGTVVAFVIAGAIPFWKAFALGPALAVGTGAIAELFVGAVSLATFVMIDVTGPIGLVVALVVGVAIWRATDRAEMRLKERLTEEAGRPVAPSLPPPAQHHAPAPA